jgi:site-specific DNA-adenine methylase/predicted RNA-binding Zn-ribbon protein involved in translation (DUF1610 family)
VTKVDSIDRALDRLAALVDIEKRALGLFGHVAGKGSIADALVKLFPEHKTYTEIFAGGAAVFWAKPKDASQIEVLNDYNSEVAHAYKFAQHVTDAQIAALKRKNWIGEKELFKRLRDSKPSDPADRFYRFMYLRKAGFMRCETSCAPDKVGVHVAKTLFDRLPVFRERLAGVKIYHGDYMKPLRAHDARDTLHFLDPPFPSYKLGIGEDEWDEERFLKALHELKGKFVLTYETRGDLNADLRKRYHVRVWRQKPNPGFNNHKRKGTTIATNYEVKKAFYVPAEFELVDADEPGALDRELPTTGLILSPCYMAQAAASGDKTLVVRNASLELANREVLALCGRQAYGVLKLGAMRQLAEPEFVGALEQHLIDAELRKEWSEQDPAWGKGSLYAWEILEADAFPMPLDVEMQDGKHGVVDGVKLLKLDLTEMTSDKIRSASDGEVRLAWLRLNQWFGGEANREEVLAAARIVADELLRRGVAIGRTALAREIGQAGKSASTLADAALRKMAGILGQKKKRLVEVDASTLDRVVAGEQEVIAAQSKAQGEFYLQVGDLEAGPVQLEPIEQIGLWKLAELAGQLRITDDIRKALWPEAKTLWLHKVSVPKADAAELTEAQAEAVVRARLLAGRWRKAIEPFMERQLRFLREDPEASQAVKFIEDLPHIADALVAALDQIDIQPKPKVETKADESAVVLARELAAALESFVDRVPAGTIKQGLDYALSGLRELDRLSREEFLHEGGHLAMRDTASINPSGERLGEPLALQDVLANVKPIVLRRNAILLVGGVANHGSTVNDVDLLIRGPLDPGTAHVIKFRLGRMFPPEISKRIQFLQDDDLGGPFTDHVELYDLCLVPRTHGMKPEAGPEVFKVIEMRGVLKADDPLMDLPDKRGKYRAAYQFHFRGRSLHADLRMAVNDHLIGWTMANQVADKVPRVEDVAQARRLARRFDRAGNFFLKTWLAPSGLFATPKTRMPKSWLELDGEKFEPGEIGATANEPGVIVRVTDPELRVEYGLQKPWAHEYFFTGDPKFTGRLFYRLLTGEGGPVDEEEAGRATGAGEVYWRSFWAKTLLPSVLSSRAVETRSMPPDGYSALPASLEALVPEEYRYWDKKGEEARKLRDALVEAKLFTDDNVAIVDGEFRRVVRKTYLDLGLASVQDQDQKSARYGLSWQFWKGQQVIRQAPSRQVWHLVVERPDGSFDAWKLQANPLEEEQPISGVHRPLKSDALLDFDGAVSPGQDIGGEVLNENKATDSWIKHLDGGRARVLERADDKILVRFLGKMQGDFELAREEAGSDFWSMTRVSSRTPSDKARGAVLFVQREDLAYLACPTCGSVNVRKAGDRQLEKRYTAIGCNECGTEFGVRGEVQRRDQLEGTQGLELCDRDDPNNARLLKAVPMRDGIQEWDPDRRDPDLDRGMLRPLAHYQPMKVPPRTTNEFRKVEDILDSFATPALLSMGIMVEPKYNGFRISLQKKSGRVLVFTEDEKRDLSGVLPGFTSELKAINGDFVIDAEAMGVDKDGQFLPRRDLAQFRSTKPVDDRGVRVFAFDALYVPQAGNILGKTQVERRRRLDALLKGGKGDRIALAPFVIAKTKDELLEGIEWASKQPGSEGAMLKGVEATYSLGGENDLWAKYKLNRHLKAVVHARDPVKDSPGVWTLFGAVGPIAERDADKWSETVEVNGKLYVPIGKTFNTELDAKPGDVIEVEVTEILLDQSGAKARLRWFTPTVVGPTNEKPDRIEDVQEKLQAGEVKKLLAMALQKRVTLVKTKEERYVLGIVLEPNDGEHGVPLDPDTQHDIYSAQSVRDAAHRFMERFGNMGLQHQKLINDKVKILESYVAPCELDIEGPAGGKSTRIRSGTWLMAVRVLDDKLWRDIKEGAITGYSIGGSAIRSEA